MFWVISDFLFSPAEENATEKASIIDLSTKVETNQITFVFHIYVYYVS